MRREREPEIMDDPSLEEHLHYSALAGLERLNKFSGSAKILWRPIRELALSFPGESLRVLDVATGSGDIPLALTLLARRERLAIEVDGCDMSDRAIACAQRRASEYGTNSQFFRLNVLDEVLPSGYDVIMTSLFTHHLDPVEVTALIRSMSAGTKRMLIVSDLVRSFFNLVSVTVATRILTGCDIVHNDGPASVRAAYTVEEFRNMASQAGLKSESFTLKQVFPARMLLVGQK